MKRYAIWNKQDTIYTPSGAKFTAEQWIARHPIAENPNITIICSAGIYNGAFFGTLGQLKEVYEEDGCDFTGCETDQSILDKIEAFMDGQKAKIKTEPSTEERTAAALEFIAMSSLPDDPELN